MPTRQFLFIRSSQPENTYGRFTMELLKAEGFNGFHIIDLDDEPLPEFMPDDLVILSRCFLRRTEMRQLLAGIKNGVRVVCLQPSWEVAEAFGWKSQNRVVYPSWIRIREGYPGSGEPIQTHLPVTAYTPAQELDYEVLADAVLTDWAEGGCPAVIRQPFGRGEVVLFFYDLPETIARIRFGNPDLASHRTNGYWGWTHTCDLFDGHVDPRVLHLPQADFHSQLLARALTDICSYPLARFWYYPDVTMRAAAVFQSDDDHSTPEQFQALADMLRRHDAVGTFYLMEDTLLPDETVATMRDEGHTFAPHVVGAMSSEDMYFCFPAELARETAVFNTRYGQCSTSLQSHCAPWLGYQSWVPLHIENGYRLLFAYMSVPPERMNTYMCGSGRPLRFYDRDGQLFDCWQQPLITYDDASIAERVQTDPKGVIAEFQALLQPALERHHGTIAVLSHPVSFATYSSPYIEGCFDLLAQENVPVYNGDQWCAYLDQRDAVRITQHIHESCVTCTVSQLSGSLPLMLPLREASDISIVQVNGKPSTAIIVERLGQQYLVIQLESKPDASDIVIEVDLPR